MSKNAKGNLLHKNKEIIMDRNNVVVAHKEIVKQAQNYTDKQKQQNDSVKEEWTKQLDHKEKQEKVNKSIDLVKEFVEN